MQIECPKLCVNLSYSLCTVRQAKNAIDNNYKLETASIAEPLQNRQHAQNPLMLSTLSVVTIEIVISI